MLILLSDGAGLTARQCATVLARAGHRVEALSPAGLCLCRMTRHVRKVHDVPALGRDPFGWLEAALDVAVRRGADLLLPVQEQVTVMSLARDRIEAAGLAAAVPAFAALAQVQDKVSAYRTLARAGLPQPAALVAATAAELEDARAPAFVKTPIGTASAGVRRAGSRAELRRLAADYERQGVFGQEGVLVQQPAPARWPWSRRSSHTASSSRSTPASGSARAPRAGPATSSGCTCRAREHMAAGRDPGLARRAVRGHDPRAGRAAVHRRQSAPGGAGQRTRLGRRPGAGTNGGGHVRDVAPAAGRAGWRADPSAPARRARRGAARFAAGGGAGAARRRARPRLLPGQPGRADAGAPRPARPAAGRGHRPDHADPAERLAALHGGSTGAYSLTPAAWRQIRQAAANGPGAVAPGPPSGLVSRCR